MSKAMKNFLTLAGVVVVGAFLVFVYDSIAGLADFAGRIRPEFTPFVFWGLLVPTAATFAWWVGMALLRPRPIMVHANPTEEEMAGFRRQLVKRLSRNRILRDNGVSVEDESGLDMGLMVLRDRADGEIRNTAKRVFIGTAVSQNGRLDALVVLFLITRLVWRISKLYDQRPHHRELINLYANIAATAFLAGSLDEFGIEDTIHELIGPLMAGSALGAVPGAEAVAGTITASILTGSTNALLAMRCGIVARNYMSLELDTKGRMRRNATTEAARMFMTISGDTVTRVTRLLVKSSSDAAKKNARRVARCVVESVADAAGAVGSGAKSAGRGVKDSATRAGRGVRDSARKMGDAAGSAGRGVRGSAQKAYGGVTGTARKVGDGARNVGRGVAGSAKSVARSVDRAADRLASGIKGAARKVQKTARPMSRDFGPAQDRAEARVDKVTARVGALLRSVRRSRSKSGSEAEKKSASDKSE